MWISKQIAAVQEKPVAEFAQVTGESTAQGRQEYRSLRRAAPWGVAYLPPATAQAVLVESTSGMVCVGTLSESKNLSPGELLLYSAGGARIYLKNNGEVEINGQVFPAAEE